VNLKTLALTIASKYGNKDAAVSGDNRLSYRELDVASNRAARALAALGIGRGDRVAFLLANSPEFIIAFFGVVKIGAIAVPLDPKYKLAEIQSLFGDCKPKAVFAEGSCLETLLKSRDLFPYLQQVIDFANARAGLPWFRRMLEEADEAPLEFEPDSGDLAVIAYTSGASFKPRGIMLTHGSICFEAEVSGEGFAQTERDIVSVFALPLHHAFCPD
jgi:long-chain acyl-CoA synthetase